MKHEVEGVRNFKEKIANEEVYPFNVGVFLTSIVSLEYNATQPLGHFVLTVHHPVLTEACKIFQTQAVYFVI